MAGPPPSVPSTSASSDEQSPRPAEIGDSLPVDWQGLVDSTVLPTLVGYASASDGRVETVYVTGSYLRGSWSPQRPNVNVYFVAADGHAPAVRIALGRHFHGLRTELRAAGVDLVVDCHPYTISQRDPEWLDRPTLTLTTKVLAGEARDERYLIAPSIGLGWYVAHKVVFGRLDSLDVFAKPPVKDRSWLSGVHEALSHYRNVLDHLPWALDSLATPHRLLEESCRYAEEALRDGVHVGLDDDELAAGDNIRILHDWAEVGREFFASRYGEAGAVACDTVARLKAAVGRGACTPADAEGAWLEALDVWSVVWDGYLRLARRLDADPELLKVTAWL